MIKTVDIEKFGLFLNYRWDNEIGSDPAKDLFKKVNIIYGRNYSGKTTLSRIFRSVENEALHKDYLDCKFKLSTDDGTVLSESNLVYSKKIRVYNSDFVKDNLSWLHDEDGEILPFTLLGGDNTIIEEKINLINNKLGFLEEGKEDYKDGTLYSRRKQKKEELDNLNKQSTRLQQDLNNRLTERANKHIKVNPNFIKQGVQYNVTNLQKEIDDIINNPLQSSLSDEEITAKRRIIKEDAKAPIPQLPYIDLEFQGLIYKTKTLVSREITLSATLKELIENDLLQAWVNQGRALHREKDTCAFCGSIILPERRKELNEHFSKESTELENEINEILIALAEIRDKTKNYLININLQAVKFYAANQPEYNTIHERWNEAANRQIEQISFLESKLNERLQNLFRPVSEINFSHIESNTIDFNLIINDFNSLIGKNEKKTESLEKDKDTARKTLRYNDIDSFLSAINYKSALKTIKESNEKAKKISEEYEILISEIKQNEEKKIELEKQLKDESRAAQKINKHLNDFFGHDGLQLLPTEKEQNGEKQTRFVIKRGEKDAKNLSEGECSLIAFCYFMARIDDELQDINAKNNLIIYIDDPISSLDNNHIFFMFGLINTVITFSEKIDNVRFCQLFISTHNLEFLKYLHRLSPFSGLYKKDSNENMIHLLVEKRRMKDEYRSIVRLMPKHLRINTTEYIYLFEQIYDIAKPYGDVADKIKSYEENYTLLYNIGNNMRRFMEFFLSFKYAGENEPLYLLKDFFDEHEGSQLNRASNEYSHLSWLEKGTMLLDIPEAERIAIMILKCIKKTDEFHFNSLCKKIDADPNIITV